MLYWRNVDRNKLNPLFAAAIDNLFSSLPDNWYVTFGLRTREEQAALWEKYKKGGPRAAPPGYSPHEFGLAIDVVLDAEPKQKGLQASWDINDPRWKNMIEAVRRSRYLHSGVSFGDGGHIEMVDWKARI